VRYVFLTGTGLKVSELCLGTTGLGTNTPADESRKILDRCLDAGVSFFDTADASPESEELLGAWAGDRRHSLVVSTKVFRPTGPGPNDAGLSRKHIVRACEDSLRRLRTDRIDLYFAHSDDFLTPLEETLSAFDQLVRQGKVLYVGASNHTAWRLNEALWIALTRNQARYCCVQAQYNLLVRDIDTDLLPMCVQKGVSIVACSPFAHGVLAKSDAANADEGVEDASDPAHKAARARRNICSVLEEVAARSSRPMSQVALRWVLDRPGVNAVAVGASSLLQIEESLGVYDFQLTPEHSAMLDDASKPHMPYPALIEPYVRALRGS
jgi:aryl-alcohol dehydrogenase-like predicted oxidoreductase